MLIKIKHYETIIEVETTDSVSESHNNDYILKIIKEVFNQITELKK
jgi:hypothetical protein